MGVKPAIGRKSNKNPPIFSHEFVIQNHADIVSCAVMVFLVGLMVQVCLISCHVSRSSGWCFLLYPLYFGLIGVLQSTSPIASLFISLHHNVSGAEPTREALKGEPYFYEAGWKDSCAVFFYSLVCIVLHAILQEYFLDVSTYKIFIVLWIVLLTAVDYNTS